MPEPMIAPGVQTRYLLICHSCEHAWEPDLTDPGELDGSETGCPRCGGWTWLGEITEPESAPADARTTRKRAS